MQVYRLLREDILRQVYPQGSRLPSKRTIAQETGVTQASLLNAAKGSKKTTASSTAAKSSMQVTATERRLVELYRQAESKNKKAAMKLLKGEEEFAEEVLGNILEGVADLLTGK